MEDRKTNYFEQAGLMPPKFCMQPVENKNEMNAAGDFSLYRVPDFPPCTLFASSYLPETREDRERLVVMSSHIGEAVFDIRKEEVVFNENTMNQYFRIPAYKDLIVFVFLALRSKGITIPYTRHKAKTTLLGLGYSPIYTWNKNWEPKKADILKGTEPIPTIKDLGVDFNEEGFLVVKFWFPLTIGSCYKGAFPCDWDTRSIKTNKTQTAFKHFSRPIIEDIEGSDYSRFHIRKLQDIRQKWETSIYWGFSGMKTPCLTRDEWFASATADRRILAYSAKFKMLDLMEAPIPTDYQFTRNLIFINPETEKQYFEAIKEEELRKKKAEEDAEKAKEAARLALVEKEKAEKLAEEKRLLTKQKAEKRKARIAGFWSFVKFMLITGPLAAGLVYVIKLWVSGYWS